jgi:hypothetical protein
LPCAPGRLTLYGRAACFAGDYERLHVSSQNKAAQARCGVPFESGHTNVSQIDSLPKNWASRLELVRMDSQAKYAVLAAGQGELMLPAFARPAKVPGKNLGSGGWFSGAGGGRRVYQRPGWQSARFHYRAGFM